MPGQRHYIMYAVTKENMCELAPMTVEEMMRQFVRTVSPNWATVRLEIIDGPMNSWDMRLTGEGTERPERPRGQRG